MSTYLRDSLIGLSEEELNILINPWFDEFMGDPKPAKTSNPWDGYEDEFNEEAFIREMHDAMDAEVGLLIQEPSQEHDPSWDDWLWDPDPWDDLYPQEDDSLDDFSSLGSDPYYDGQYLEQMGVKVVDFEIHETFYEKIISRISSLFNKFMTAIRGN